MLPLFLIASCLLSLPSLLSFIFLQQQPTSSIHTAGVCRAPGSRFLPELGRQKRTHSEGLAEEVASLSPPYFPNLTPLFPPRQPHLTHQTVIRTFILPSIFFSDTLQFSYPSKGLCLLKETHLGWGKRDRREGDIGVR